MKIKIQLIIFSTLLISNLQAKEIYATFTVYAKQTANLSFNYSGIVKSIDADIMKEVKEGDVLATLKSDDLIASNNLSKVTLKYAELDFERHKKLLAKRLIDKAQLDKYALAFDSIKAQVELEKTIYDKTILRAPFDGVITLRMIETGDLVSAQRLSTAFIIQSLRLRILVVEFDQKYNNDVKIGDKFVYHIDGDDKEYQGKVFRIYPTVNKENRKISLQVVARDLKVGMFGEGKLITSDETVPLLTNSKTETE